MDARKWLLGLHALSLAFAVVSSIHEWVLIPTRIYEKLYKVAYASISALLSAPLLVVGALSHALHHESSAVVHNCLMLSFLHLTAYSFSMYCTNRQNFSSSLVSTSLNMLLLLLSCVQVAISSYDLRARGNSWPRGKMVQLFTVETLILIVRMIVAVLSAPNSWFLVVVLGSDTVFGSFSAIVAFHYNILTTCEGIMSVYWGVPHRKLTAVNSLVSGGLLAGSSIYNYPHFSAHVPPKKFLSESARELIVGLFPIAAVLASSHGLLSVFMPTFITSVPAIFHKVQQTSRSDERFGTRRRASGSTETSMESTSQQFSRLYGVDSVNEVDDTAEGFTSRLAVVQLFRDGSFTRNFISCVVGVPGVVLGIVAAQYRHQLLPVNRDGAILLVCFGACLLLRSLPAVLVSVQTRRPVPDPPSNQVAVAVAFECMLALTGVILSFSINPYLIVATVTTLLLLMIQFLHLNGIVRRQKLAAASV